MGHRFRLAVSVGDVCNICSSALLRACSARMDTYLAEYDPLDKEAYRRLQAATEVEGLSPWSLDEWLSREYDALDIADGIQPASARRGRFLRKKV